MDTTLVVMAAGMASRYGGNKQIAGMGPNNEILLEYSVCDAIRAGFNKVVFIIRPEMLSDIKRICGDKLAGKIRVEYAFQDYSSLPAWYAVPEGRVKPFGTVHAVLCARAAVHEPFAVINADDYYGKEAYRALHAYLCAPHGDRELCMAGFILKNTLSDNGGVTRGLCRVDGDGFLTEVVETSDIVRVPGGAAVQGRPVDGDGYVSMNMWGFPSAAFMDVLSENFARFFEEDVPQNPLKAEYLLPVLIGRLLKEDAVRVRVLPTSDVWYGVTYAEDRAAVANSIEALVRSGMYAAELYGDLGTREKGTGNNREQATGNREQE